MLISIAMMFLVGMSMGWICKKIHLPSLFGMIVTGIVLGPYVLDVIDASILNISSDLRRIALIIILMRAGLSLDLNDLKKVGRPAVLMCFVPACFEIGGMVLLAPNFDFGCRYYGNGHCRGFSGSYCAENVETDGGRIRCKEEHPSDDSCRSIG